MIISDSIQSLHEKSFVFDNNIKHRHTPARNNRHENLNNTDEGQTKKLTFCFERLNCHNCCYILTKVAKLQKYT